MSHSSRPSVLTAQGPNCLNKYCSTWWYTWNMPPIDEHEGNMNQFNLNFVALRGSSPLVTPINSVAIEFISELCSTAPTGAHFLLNHLACVTQDKLSLEITSEKQMS